MLWLRLSRPATRLRCNLHQSCFDLCHLPCTYDTNGAIENTYVFLFSPNLQMLPSITREKRFSSSSSSSLHRANDITGNTYTSRKKKNKTNLRIVVAKASGKYEDNVKRFLESYSTSWENRKTFWGGAMTRMIKRSRLREERIKVA